MCNHRLEMEDQLMGYPKEVRLALPPRILAQLLAEKKMSIEDFRCLDGQTKSCVKGIFLENLRREMAMVR